MHKRMRRFLFGTASAFLLFAGIMSSSIFAKAGEIAVSNENFPDDEFRKYIERKIDKDENMILSDSEIEAISTININGDYYDVKDLTGIKYFYNVETLKCSSRHLSEVDLSGMVQLKKLTIEDDNVKKVDFSGCTNLITLVLNGAKLKEISDLSEMEELQSLSLCETRIKSLNVSNMANLKNLACPGNRLTKVDVSNCVNLTKADLEDNQLTELDMSGCKSLSDLIVTNNQLTQLVISDCEELRKLEVGTNQLTQLNLQKATQLRFLDCSNNQLSSLDLSGNEKLEKLVCEDNHLETLNISECYDLKELQCSDNQLKTLDLTEAEKLRTLRCNNNLLTSLKVPANVRRLECTENYLSYLNLDDAKRLKNTNASIDEQYPVAVVFDNAGIKIQGLDMSRVSEVEGASVQNKMFIPEEGASKIVYVYDNGNDKVTNAQYKLLNENHTHKYSEKWKSDEETHYKICEECGDKKDVEKHNNVEEIKKATIKYSNGTYKTRDGKRNVTCTICKRKDDSETILAPKYDCSGFEHKKYSYTGKTRSPKLSVRTGSTQELPKKFYTVKKDEGRKEVGTYKYMVEFDSKYYEGDMNPSFDIVPERTHVKKIKGIDGGFDVSWQQKTKQIDGYYIEYRPFFSNKKWSKVVINDTSVTKKKITGLPKGKLYGVRLRTFKKIGDKEYSSIVGSVDEKRVRIK